MSFIDESFIAKTFSHISFEPKKHVYISTETNRNLISVTTLLNKYKKPFEQEYFSQKKAAEEQVSQHVILERWRFQKEFACLRGNEFHFYVETFLKTGKSNPTFTGIDNQIAEFHKFWHKYSQLLDVVCVEVRMGDDDLQIAGTMDLLLRNKKTGRYIAVDWKTNTEFKYINAWDQLLPPFADYDASDLSIYSLQIEIYKQILMKNIPDMNFDRGFIVHFPSNAPHKVIPIHDVETPVKKLLYKVNAE